MINFIDADPIAAAGDVAVGVSCGYSQPAC
ncbi:hypothetical protein SAMN04489812_2263 [Microlunatus soli]|uniref:Uncharacterized protein n=1 Tax=Microlunatus soli TaxID=630515 RepID=A0A1H1T5L3_9ACTN|nr:hypothetical protein SAMN04489812_2263 [Microlunatus soli]